MWKGYSQGKEGGLLLLPIQRTTREKKRNRKDNQEKNQLSSLCSSDKSASIHPFTKDYIHSNIKDIKKYYTLDQRSHNPTNHLISWGIACKRRIRNVLVSLYYCWFIGWCWCSCRAGGKWLWLWLFGLATMYFFSN